MSFLESVGLVSISLLLLYLIKKSSDHFYLKKADYQADGRVYKAAGEFVRGASSGDIRGLLANCIDFDEKDIEEILSRAFSHRSDADGGYGAFLKAVDEVLGEDVYGETRRAN
jgi:hypothetical protein